jgi:endothelin-converting enzyme/putative endopeptidase
MIKNIFIAFENRINNLPWMSAETKVSAVEKLHKSQIKIGYLTKKDYSALVIKSPEEGGTYFENTLNMAKWRFQDDLADLKNQ